MAAHLLARNAQFVSESIVWVEDIPPCIEFQVSKDVANLDFVQLNEQFGSVNIKKKNNKKKNKERIITYATSFAVVAPPLQLAPEDVNQTRASVPTTH